MSALEMNFWDKNIETVHSYRHQNTKSEKKKVHGRFSFRKKPELKYIYIPTEKHPAHELQFFKNIMIHNDRSMQFT